MQRNGNVTIKEEINRAWDSKSIKIEWNDLEFLVADIFKSDFSNKEKLELIAESFDAYCKRGIFRKYYK